MLRIQTVTEAAMPSLSPLPPLPRLRRFTFRFCDSRSVYMLMWLSFRSLCGEPFPLTQSWRFGARIARIATGIVRLNYLLRQAAISVAVCNNNDATNGTTELMAL